ncbi:MAG: hypothetical protein ABIL58_23225 [Pseudomonadota bacterium]
MDFTRDQTTLFLHPMGTDRGLSPSGSFLPGDTVKVFNSECVVFRTGVVFSLGYGINEQSDITVGGGMIGDTITISGVTPMGAMVGTSVTITATPPVRKWKDTIADIVASLPGVQAYFLENRLYFEAISVHGESPFDLALTANNESPGATLNFGTIEKMTTAYGGMIEFSPTGDEIGPGQWGEFTFLRSAWVKTGSGAWG